MSKLDKNSKELIKKIVASQYSINSKWISSVNIELTKSHRTSNYSGVVMDVIKPPSIISKGTVFEILEINSCINRFDWLDVSIKIGINNTQGWVLIWNGSKEVFLSDCKDIQRFIGYLNYETIDLNTLWTSK